MLRRKRIRRRPVRRASDVTRALAHARLSAGLTYAAVGRVLGLHAKSISRWERGESRPKETLWPRLLALYASRAPDATAALATIAGRSVPVARAAPAFDPELAERVVVRAADALDIAPRRVRDVLRVAAQAAAEAGLGFDRLLGSVVAEAGAPPPTPRAGP